MGWWQPVSFDDNNFVNAPCCKLVPPDHTPAPFHWLPIDSKGYVTSYGCCDNTTPPSSNGSQEGDITTTPCVTNNTFTWTWNAFTGKWQIGTWMGDSNTCPCRDSSPPSYPGSTDGETATTVCMVDNTQQWVWTAEGAEEYTDCLPNNTVEWVWHEGFWRFNSGWFNGCCYPPDTNGTQDGEQRTIVCNDKDEVEWEYTGDKWTPDNSPTGCDSDPPDHSGTNDGDVAITICLKKDEIKWQWFDTQWSPIDPPSCCDNWTAPSTPGTVRGQVVTTTCLKENKRHWTWTNGEWKRKWGDGCCSGQPPQNTPSGDDRTAKTPKNTAEVTWQWVAPQWEQLNRPAACCEPDYQHSTQAKYPDHDGQKEGDKTTTNCLAHNHKLKWRWHTGHWVNPGTYGYDVLKSSPVCPQQCDCNLLKQNFSCIDALPSSYETSGDVSLVAEPTLVAPSLGQSFWTTPDNGATWAYQSGCPDGSVGVQPPIHYNPGNGYTWCGCVDPSHRNQMKWVWRDKKSTWQWTQWDEATNSGQWTLVHSDCGGYYDPTTAEPPRHPGKANGSQETVDCPYNKRWVLDKNLCETEFGYSGFNVSSCTCAAFQPETKTAKWKWTSEDKTWEKQSGECDTPPDCDGLDDGDVVTTYCHTDGDVVWMDCKQTHKLRLGGNSSITVSYGKTKTCDIVASVDVSNASAGDEVKIEMGDFYAYFKFGQTDGTTHAGSIDPYPQFPGAAELANEGWIGVFDGSTLRQHRSTGMYLGNKTLSMWLRNSEEAGESRYVCTATVGNALESQSTAYVSPPSDEKVMIATGQSGGLFFDNLTIQEATRTWNTDKWGHRIPLTEDNPCYDDEASYGTLGDPYASCAGGGGENHWCKDWIAPSSITVEISGIYSPPPGDPPPFNPNYTPCPSCSSLNGSYTLDKNDLCFGAGCFGQGYVYMGTSSCGDFTIVLDFTNNSVSLTIVPYHPPLYRNGNGGGGLEMGRTGSNFTVGRIDCLGSDLLNLMADSPLPVWNYTALSWDKPDDYWHPYTCWLTEGTTWRITDVDY